MTIAIIRYLVSHAYSLPNVTSLNLKSSSGMASSLSLNIQSFGHAETTSSGVLTTEKASILE